jgi:hypothetical protein
MTTKIKNILKYALILSFSIGALDGLFILINAEKLGMAGIPYLFALVGLAIIFIVSLIGFLYFKHLEQNLKPVQERSYVYFMIVVIALSFLSFITMMSGGALMFLFVIMWIVVLCTWKHSFSLLPLLVSLLLLFYVGLSSLLYYHSGYPLITIASLIFQTTASFLLISERISFNRIKQI